MAANYWSSNVEWVKKLESRVLLGAYFQMETLAGTLMRQNVLLATRNRYTEFSILLIFDSFNYIYKFCWSVRGRCNKLYEKCT